MKIALVQMAMSENVRENRQRVLTYMDEAARSGADAVCFPEIQYSPFFPQYKAQDVSQYIMGIDHPVMQEFCEKCSEHGVVGFPNIYLEESGELYDASPVVDATGDVLGISKMVHIASFPQFFEQDYYTPADTGFHVYDTAVGRVGVVICFDRHFPESIRTCALKGADLIIIPTANTKSEPMDLFEAEIRTAAMQNVVFIAMCNRVGSEGSMDFSGESIVVDPYGNVVLKASGESELVYASIDLSEVAVARKKVPYLELLRPKKYDLPSA